MSVWACLGFGYGLSLWAGIGALDLEDREDWLLVFIVGSIFSAIALVCSGAA